MLNARLDIQMFQSCDVRYAPMLQVVSEANRAYAKLHGYAYSATIENCSITPYTANFNRFYLLRESILQGGYDWALWMDADAVVVDPRIKLESFIRDNSDKLIIACRGADKGDFDINNGVFFLNLKHPLALDVVNECIRYVESLPADNRAFHHDQKVMHSWLRTKEDSAGKIDCLKCYRGQQYNLFNYDGRFIQHVLSEGRDFKWRMNRLQSLARECLEIARTMEFPQCNDTTELHSPATIRCVARPIGKIRSSNSFQKQNRILVASVADYQSFPTSSKWLLESCGKFGIDLTLVGVGQPYENNRSKVSYIAEYLQENNQFDYILQVDFKDLLFCASLQELFCKYKAFQKEIVTGAERSNWPTPSHIERCPKTETTYRYLNSGTVFSTRTAWLQAWKLMQDREVQFQGIAPEQSSNGYHLFNCDQGAWSDLYVNGLMDIAIDSDCSMFQCLFHTDWYIKSENQDFVFEGSRIINRESWTRPCIVHANGCVPIEPWGQYSLESPTTWNWEMIDKIRQAPIEKIQTVRGLEDLILEVGLHRDLVESIEPNIYPFTGKGLEIRSLPSELAPFLVWLAKHPNLESLAQIGLGNGGNFIFLVEYLRRFHSLQTVLAFDESISKHVYDYGTRTKGIQVISKIPTDDAVRKLMPADTKIGLLWVDGCVTEELSRANWGRQSPISKLTAIQGTHFAVPTSRQAGWFGVPLHFLRRKDFVSEKKTSSFHGIRVTLN